MNIHYPRRTIARILADSNQRDPEDNSKSKDRLDYWLWLAKLAEKGKITSVFIADSYAGHNIYGGSADASYKGGSHIGKLDPLMIGIHLSTPYSSLKYLIY